MSNSATNKLIKYSCQFGVIVGASLPTDEAFLHKPWLVLQVVSVSFPFLILSEISNWGTYLEF